MAEGFGAKPARGWLHPDSVLSREGVDYTVRYIGCLEILESMKSMDFETRSQVSKECIVRVCEAAGLKSADKKRRVHNVVQRALAQRPRMTHSGTNVALTISSKALTLAALDDGEVIARHEMPRVSFASGGEADTLDFVAYVAKSGAPEWRACYVIECGGRLAQDVISTIGQAFELRFKEFLTKPDSCEENVRHYVNQTPPPRTPPTALLPTFFDMFDMQPFTAAPAETANVSPPAPEPANLVPPPQARPDAAKPLTTSQQMELLEMEPWYHGAISRAESEKLVVDDGDFLVRESCACAGQFVLTGMRDGLCKHLLLVDPMGVVRTKETVFDSVPHLINYHSNNNLPIVSADSSLLLSQPIIRKNEL